MYIETADIDMDVDSEEDDDDPSYKQVNFVTPLNLNIHLIPID